MMQSSQWVGGHWTPSKFTFMLCPVTPSGYWLINSSPVPSYPYIVNGTHVIHNPPCKSCHTHTILSTHPHPDILMLQPCSPVTIAISHTSYNLPIPIFHLS